MDKSVFFMATVRHTFPTLWNLAINQPIWQRSNCRFKVGCWVNNSTSKFSADIMRVVSGHKFILFHSFVWLIGYIHR